MKFAKSWGRLGVSLTVIAGPHDAVGFQDRSPLTQLPDSVVRESASDPSPWRMAARVQARLPKRGRWYLLARALTPIVWVGDHLAPLDPQVCWGAPALWRALRVARRSRPDVVLVSGPPFSPFLVGALVSRLLRVPLVLDYRDPWMTSPMFRRVGRLRGRLNSFLERRIVRRSAGVVAAHRFILRELRALIPASTLSRPRLFWVPNGYDPEDFAGTTTSTSQKFILNYAGAIYGKRSPAVLLKAVEELLKEGSIDASRFRIRFAGHVAQVKEFYPSKSLLSQVVQLHGYLPHRESARLLQECTVNLVIVGARAGPTTWVPAKLYENLYAGRPVFLLSGEGVPTHLARRAGGCSIAHPDDKDAIKQALIGLYRTWERGELFEGPDRNRIAFFDRNHQAIRLLRFLSSTLQGGAT